MLESWNMSTKTNFAKPLLASEIFIIFINLFLWSAFIYLLMISVIILLRNLVLSYGGKDG